MLQLHRNTADRAPARDCAGCNGQTRGSGQSTGAAQAVPFAPAALPGRAAFLLSAASVVRCAALKAVEGGRGASMHVVALLVCFFVGVPVVVVATVLLISLRGSRAGGTEATNDGVPREPKDAQGARLMQSSGLPVVQARSLGGMDPPTISSVGSFDVNAHMPDINAHMPDTREFLLRGMDGPLCEAMLVPASDGATLIISCPTLITPGPQCIVATVSSMENSSGSTNTIARLFFSETGHDGGILLEAGPRFPIAFLDTALAGGDRRCIPIRRAFDRGMSPFGFVKAIGLAGQYVVCSDAAGTEEPLLSLQVPLLTPGSSDVRSANVTDGRGQLLASMERHGPQPGGGASVRYYVRFGHARADGALVMLAVVAALKLGAG